MQSKFVSPDGSEPLYSLKGALGQIPNERQGYTFVLLVERLAARVSKIPPFRYLLSGAKGFWSPTQKTATRTFAVVSAITESQNDREEQRLCYNIQPTRNGSHIGFASPRADWLEMPHSHVQGSFWRWFL